jgi:hypothetical protein
MEQGTGLMEQYGEANFYWQTGVPSGVWLVFRYFRYLALKRLSGNRPEFSPASYG